MEFRKLSTFTDIKLTVPFPPMNLKNGFNFCLLLKEMGPLIYALTYVFLKLVTKQLLKELYFQQYLLRDGD